MSADKKTITLTVASTPFVLNVESGSVPPSNNTGGGGPGHSPNQPVYDDIFAMERGEHGEGRSHLFANKKEAESFRSCINSLSCRAQNSKNKDARRNSRRLPWPWMVTTRGFPQVDGTYLLKWWVRSRKA